MTYPTYIRTRHSNNANQTPQTMNQVRRSGTASTSIQVGMTGHIATSISQTTFRCTGYVQMMQELDLRVQCTQVSRLSDTRFIVPELTLIAARLKSTLIAVNIDTSERVLHTWDYNELH